MKTKIALAVSMALLSSAANAQTVLSPTGETIQLDIPAELSNDSTRGRLTAVNNQDVKFIPEPEFAEGEHTYIVRLRDSAVANYQGEIPGFKATSPQHIQSTSQAKGTGKTGNVKLNAAAPEVKNYVSFLKVKQGGRSKFCVRLIFKFPARYLNVLQNKSLTEINKGSNCGLAWSIYLRRLICLRKVASTSYFH